MIACRCGASNFGVRVRIRAIQAANSKLGNHEVSSGMTLHLPFSLEAEAFE